MRLRETDHRTVPPTNRHLRLRAEFVVLLMLIVITTWQSASSEQRDAGAVGNQAPLTTDQIVQNLVRMNLHRARALHSYQGTRTYRVEYRGFAGVRRAEMVVKVNYLSPATKGFIIESTSGSQLIIDKVLTKLLEAEKEALDANIQRRSALTGDNYDFTLVGNEVTGARSVYVLIVEPKTKDKFLYRGRIWVDAEDFAVVRMEAEPAKNPSFWTKKAEIVQLYCKIRDFWLPEYNHSLTAIRLGGHAELTIEYKDYKINGASQVSGLSTVPRWRRVLGTTTKCAFSLGTLTSRASGYVISQRLAIHIGLLPQSDQVLFIAVSRPTQ